MIRSQTPPQKRKRESGQAAALVVLAMGIFVLGAVGIALDGSALYAHLQMAQSAADGAAQAGALSVFHGTNTGFATGTTRQTCTDTNAAVPCAFARMNGFGSADDTVTLEFTHYNGVSTNFALGNGHATISPDYLPVSVTIHRSVAPTFLRLFGVSALDVTRVATAAVVTAPITNCITVLDPSAPSVLSVAGNAHVDVTSCGIAIKSRSDSAINIAGNASVQADSITMVTAPDGNTSSIHPYPPTYVSATTITDPFANIPEPTYSSVCDHTGFSTSSSETLLPGTYCNGISIGGNSSTTVTLSPGTYVLLGGGLTIAGNAAVRGSEITFFNTFDASHAYENINFSGNANLNLSAPSTGSLAGILFFDSRSAPVGAVQTMSGNAQPTYVGALYFPQNTVKYSGNAGPGGVAQNFAIIADKVSLSGNGKLQEDSTQSGAPRQTNIALIE